MRKRIHALGLATLYSGVLALFLAAAVLGSNVTTLATKNQQIEQQCCVVIDAGHGLPDGGATSCTGALESDINLQIAKRLEGVLHLLGYQTVMLRNDENAIFTEGSSIAAKKVSDIRNRVNTINNTKGAILVSIHQNHFNDGRYSGAQIFYSATNGSRDLADKIQAALIKHINPSNNRKIKKASGIYLMEKISCTGVLVECGFLSNPEESVMLENDLYQKNLCCVIGTAIGSYINTLSAVS